MRAHTSTYVTDFAARVDEASRNFNFSRSCSRNFCGCGVCQWSEGAVRLNSPRFACQKTRELERAEALSNLQSCPAACTVGAGRFLRRKIPFSRAKIVSLQFLRPEIRRISAKTGEGGSGGGVSSPPHVCLFSIDHARQISRAKAVINIDHAHAAGAGIEHRQ